MLALVAHRLLASILVVLAASFVTYFMLNAAPGDIALTLAGDSGSEKQLHAIRAELGLDQPIIVRYIRYMASLIMHGDLGQSMVSDRHVGTLIVERLPYTAALALLSLFLATGTGFVLGYAAARNAGTHWDAMLMALASLGTALPSFWIALLLIMLFSVRLRWLPVVGADTPAHIILPAITLALPTAAATARLVRSSLLDVIGSDYVRTAHAKGLGTARIMQRHVLRNAAIPVITLLGLQLGYLLGGAFIIETIFGWPGLGRLTIQAIFDRDFPVVLGATLMIAAIYVFLNFSVDALQAWLDPRTGAETI
jgi:ABC-type dipeptide/oligopeptide/nickel transport system permease component